MYKSIDQLIALFFIAITLSITACKVDSTNNWNEVDLLAYGIPIKINAPEKFEVKKTTFSSHDNFTIKGDNNYSMEIFVSDATVNEPMTIKKELLEFTQGNKFFSELVLDQDNGFIYKLVIDSSNVFYGFRKVKIQGSSQYVFQNPIMSQYDEVMARSLFESIPD
jgi:hypothetical protein